MIITLMQTACAIQQEEGVCTNQVHLLALAAGAISVGVMPDTLAHNEMH